MIAVEEELLIEEKSLKMPSIGLNFLNEDEAKQIVN
jgi:hypothetical protein